MCAVGDWRLNRRRLGERLRGALPELDVYLSSEVLPEIREFERASTTAVCACVGPLLVGYLDRLQGAVSTLGLPLLYVMGSNGGVFDIAEALRMPAMAIESGPASGVIAAALADELQIPEVIVPPAPGAFSALGLVASDLKRDYSRTLYADLVTLDPARVAELMARMEETASDMLTVAGIPADRRALVRAADVRYRRQAYELTVPMVHSPLTRAVLDDLAAQFHDKHLQTYGHANPSEAVQLVNLRLTAIGRMPSLSLARRPDPAAARRREREVWFRETGSAPCPVHWRDGLAAGEALMGPAIVEAADSTVVVPPGWIAAVDSRGYIHLSRR